MASCTATSRADPAGGTRSLSTQLATIIARKREISPGKHWEQGTCLGFAAGVGADEPQKPTGQTLEAHLPAVTGETKAAVAGARDVLSYKKSIYYMPYLILPDSLNFLCPERKESKAGRTVYNSKAIVSDGFHGLNLSILFSIASVRMDPRQVSMKAKADCD